MHFDNSDWDWFFKNNLIDWLYAGALIISCGILLYFVWQCCAELIENADDKDGADATSASGRLVMKPVYAHELEPGIVVLQSADGEYFKVVTEYNFGQRYQHTDYKHVFSTRPEMVQPIDHVVQCAYQSTVPTAPRYPYDFNQSERARDPRAEFENQCNESAAIGMSYE